MKNFKRILALVLAVMMVATSVVAISAAEADEKVVYNAEAITRLNKLGIFQGYNAADMGADDNVTRAQMALFTGRVLTGKVESNYWESYVNDTTFEDIDDIADYYVGAISYAYEQGVVIGKSDVAFDPNGNVTYQEALTMVVRSLGYTGLSYPNGFINKAMKLGLTNGIANVAYGDAAVRGVIATILYNALYAEDSLFADNFNLTSGTYMLAATPTVYVGEAVIPGASINGYVGKEINEGYVAFAPIGADYKAVNQAAKYVYAKVSQISDDLKGKQIDSNYADKLGYAFNLTFENDVLTWGDECATKTFVNYGDDLEITATPIAYNHDRTGNFNFNWFVTFGGQAYNLVDGYDKDYTAPTGTHDLILYADYGSYTQKVDAYAQCFDANGNIVDNDGVTVLLHYVDGAYYKDVTLNGVATRVKATAEEIMGAIAHFEDALNSDYAIIEAGDPIADVYANNTLGTLGATNYALTIANNYFCEITAMDYDNDGIYDAGIYTPYYIGTVNEVKDYDDNSYDGKEFTLSGITDANGTTVLSGAGATMPNVNDYTFTGKVTTPGSWAWYVYSYNRHTNEINVKEVAKAVSGKVEWGVKGAVNYYTGIYEDSQVSIGGTTYQVGGWDYNNLYGLKAVENYDSSYTDKIAAAMGVKATSTYYNGWNDVLEYGMTSACGGFKGYAIAGHLIHGVPTIAADSYKLVAFNAYQSEFAIENNQIVVDAIVDTTGEYKTIKINSVDSMEFDDIEFLVFQKYCDILYANAFNANNSLLDKYAYFFNAERLATHKATPLYKAVERAYIINRLTDNYVDWNYDEADEWLTSDEDTTLVYGVLGTDADGAYMLSSAKKPTGWYSANTAVINFTLGVSDVKIWTKSGATPVRTDADTVFTFVANDGIYTYVGMPADNYQLDLTGGNAMVFAADSDAVMIVDTTRCISDIALGDIDWAEKVQDIALAYVQDDDCTCGDGEANLDADVNDHRCDRLVRNHLDTWAFREYLPYVAAIFQADEVYLVNEKTKNDKIYYEDGVMYYVYSGLYNMIDNKYEDAVIFSGAEVDVFEDILFYENSTASVGTAYGTILTRDYIDDDVIYNAFTAADYAVVGGDNDLFCINDGFNWTGMLVGEYTGVTKDNTGAISHVKFNNVCEDGVNVGSKVYTVNKFELITVDFVFSSVGAVLTNELGTPVVTVAENGVSAVKNEHGTYSAIANEYGVNLFDNAIVYFNYDAETGTLTGYAFNRLVP